MVGHPVQEGIAMMKIAPLNAGGCWSARPETFRG
jgi:hypothetical protein